jgi:hypothetical protein
MANFINAGTIEYTVKDNPEYFIKAIRKGRTLANDYLRVLPGVTKETFVKKMVLNGGTISQVDTRDCAWNPTQRLDITGKKMSLENFMITESQCLEDLDNLYSEQLYTSGANKTEMPEGLEDVVMKLVQTALGNDIEKIIYGGNGNDVDGYQNGLVDKLLADADSIKISGVNINASNVLEEIAKVYEAIPNVVLGENWYDPENAPARIFVDMNTYRYLTVALGTTPTDVQVLLPNWSKEGDKIFYMGIEIVVVGVPANTMIAGSKDNMVFLTDLLSDTTSIKGEMGKNIVDENIFFIKGKYRASADYIFGDEIVIYSI